MILEKSDIQPIRFSTDLPDGPVTGWRWNNPEKPPLLFLHATGFCASAYRQMLECVATQFDIFALDLRGHGRNGLPANPESLRSWKPYVDDVGAFLDLHARSGWTLSGHSLGAATALMAAVGREDVSALRLIEPVAMPAWISRMAKTPAWPYFSRRMTLVKLASRRRDRWPDRERVHASYSRKALFQSWAPGALDDYLLDALSDGPPDVDGSVSLACRPVWEAATFAAQGNDFWAAARSVTAPIELLAANHRSSTLPEFGRRRFRRLGAKVTVKAGVSHLAPMEKPAEMAAFLAGKTGQ